MFLVTALGNWLLVLPGREPGEMQRRKKSALSDRLVMLPGTEPGDKQRRKRSTHSNWLQMLQGRESGEKQRRKKSGLSNTMPDVCHVRLYHHDSFPSIKSFACIAAQTP